MTRRRAPVSPRGPSVTAVAAAGNDRHAQQPACSRRSRPGPPSPSCRQDAVASTPRTSLYEYFLIDPQNAAAGADLADPARALRGPAVHRARRPQPRAPGLARRHRRSRSGTWMKRYRVWQANREVFLWPENWLYPELRDDQSPFFQQMMSGLLQGDITDDAAASAYLDYLTSLEEVAKLEPCGLYYQPGTTDTDETSYVVARTAGAHRKYYFRELTAGSWTPWTRGQDRLRGHADHADRLERPAVPVLAQGHQASASRSHASRRRDRPPTGRATTSPRMPGERPAAAFTSAAATAIEQDSVTVGAVLYWTEYLQRQMAADQDLRRQPSHDHRDLRPGRAGSFEDYRSLIRIVPAQFTGTNPIVTEPLDAQFTLPARRAAAGHLGGRPGAGLRRLRPAQHAQPAGPLRRHRAPWPSASDAAIDRRCTTVRCDLAQARAGHSRPPSPTRAGTPPAPSRSATSDALGSSPPRIRATSSSSPGCRAGWSPAGAA